MSVEFVVQVCGLGTALYDPNMKVISAGSTATEKGHVAISVTETKVVNKKQLHKASTKTHISIVLFSIK